MKAGPFPIPMPVVRFVRVLLHETLRDVVSVFPSREDLHLFLGAFAGGSSTEVLTTSGQGSLARIS